MKYTDEDIQFWARGGKQIGGGFVSVISEAWFRADLHNREILRHAIEQLVSKYPQYIEIGKR